MLNLTLRTDAIDVQLASLVEEITRKLEAGERFDETDYARRYPDQIEPLRKLLPALEALVLAGRQDEGPQRGTTLTQDASAERHGQLGDFRLVRELGRGGMGTVFEAEQMSMGRRVALKVLPFAALAQGQSLKRFQNEVRAAAALDHPHIVSVYSVGEERGVHFYAMQLVRGQTLADMIGQLRIVAGKKSQQASEAPSPNPLPNGEGMNGEAPTIDSSIAPTTTKRVEQAGISTAIDSHRPTEYYRTAARLGIEAADALQHAHDLGVLHRDIKPSNLLLDADGKLYVTDFGLARIEADAGMTMTGDIVGTLRYMAPEQALAKRVVIDHRADIYSLGATLYELLTLQPAFGETDRSDLLKQIAFEEPHPLRKVDRHIAPELETIVLTAMAKNPDERYQSAQHLANDLRAYLENRPIKAKPPTIWERAAKWSRRHVAIVWSVVAAAFILAALFAGSTAIVAESWKVTRRSEEALQLQVLAERRNLYRANVQVAQQEWEEGRVAAVDRLLDEFLPKPGQPDLRGWEWYYVKSLCHTEEKIDVGRLVARGFGSSSPLVVEQNGESTIVREFNQREIKLSLRQGQSFQVSPDGRLLACIVGHWFSPRTVIEIWDLNTRVRQSQIEFDLGITDLKWAPDSRRIAISQNPVKVNVWDATNGKNLLRLTDLEEMEVASLAWSPDGSYVAAGGNPSGVAICSSATGKLIRRMQGHTRMVGCVVFSPDGRRLASGSWDQTINIWAVDTGALERQFAAHNGKVNAVSWSLDGKFLASGGSDGIVKTWDTSTWGLLNTLVGHRDSISRLIWIDGETLLSSASDGTKLWKSQKGQKYTSIPARPAHAWTPTGRQLITWHPESGGLKLERYDLRNNAVEGIGLAGTEAPSNAPAAINVPAIDVDPTGERLAVATDAEIEIWNLTTKQRLLKINDAPNELTRVAWSPDGEMLAGGGLGGSFKVWNSATGERIATLHVGEAFPQNFNYMNRCGSAEWSPDGSCLATIEFLGNVRLWDVKRWEQIIQLPHAIGRVWSPVFRGLAWSPNGDRLAAKIADGWIYVWDAHTGRKLLDFRAHVVNIASIAWSPDGSRLATASGDHTIKVWNPDTGEDMLTLRGADAVRTLSWSPDGKILASSAVGSLNLWDATSAYAR